MKSNDNQMINLTKKQIDCALSRVGVGLKKYLSLQNDLNKIDISTNRDFQKRFNHFYRVRRNADWQSQFYKLFQNYKDKPVTFSEILGAIQKNTGRYEASFASKLVASIHPDKPVIDKFVLENVGLKLSYAPSKNREQKILSTYEKLQEKFERFLNTDNGKYLVDKFKEEFPEDAVTEVKMVDLVLWQTR